MQPKFRFVRFYTAALISLALYSFAESDDSSYLWQPVQRDMRMRRGDYQMGISNEEGCKTRCVKGSECIGVDWHITYSSCFLFYDSAASPHSEQGYHHWRIIRNGSPSIVNQGTPSTTTPAGSDISAMFTDAEKFVTKRNLNQGELYEWQPVQLDIRVKVGEYRQDTRNETACKDECLRTSSCVGVVWYNHNSVCTFHTDCSAQLNHENGFRYWRLQKYIPTPSTCQNLIGRVAVGTAEPFMKCDSQKSSRAVYTLGVVLSVSMVVIIALLINTYRLNQKIKKLSFSTDVVQVATQVQEQRFEGNNGYTNQLSDYMVAIEAERPSPTPVGRPTAEVQEQRYECNNSCANQPDYMEVIIGSETLVASENENVYDDLDEIRNRC